jgi:hypothetical protein
MVQGTLRRALEGIEDRRTRKAAFPVACDHRHGAVRALGRRRDLMAIFRWDGGFR